MKVTSHAPDFAPSSRAPTDGDSTNSNGTPMRWANAYPRSNPTPFISPDAESRITLTGLPRTSPTRSVPVGANACRTSGVGAVPLLGIWASTEAANTRKAPTTSTTMPLTTLHFEDIRGIRTLLCGKKVSTSTYGSPPINGPPRAFGAQRWRSPAAGSGSDAGADAGGSQVQRLVRGLGGGAASHAKGTGTARAFRTLLAGRPWVVVTVPALVPCARW